MATKLVTQYSNSSMNAVSKAYWELVDFLLFKYYFRHSFRAPQNLPSIDLPVPTVEITKPVEGSFDPGEPVPLKAKSLFRN
jgi:hypothetical protein